MINSYKNIAVAMDFSNNAFKAFERACKIVIDNGATLQIVNVIDTKSFASIAAYDLTYADQLKKENIVKMEDLKRKAQELGVNQVEVIIETGAPKDILTKLPGVNLMVIGSTGVNQVEKMVLGSVAERVVRLSKYDVLIVR